ncbi:MAG: hypothetical protein ACE5JO_10970 [Candidatus Binatia bacterium]
MIELTSVLNFRYDSVFDWDGEDLSDTARKEQEYYRKTKQILRELYAKIYWEKLLLQIGKQQVVWGKMEGKVIDIVNPDFDSWRGPTNAGDNFEFSRIPVWMVNLLYLWKEYSINLIWVPDFEPDNWGIGSPGIAPGGPWSLRNDGNAHPFRVDKPSAAFRNHEWGVRVDMFKKGWNHGFFYFYSWDDKPTIFRRSWGQEAKHTRIHELGYAVDKSFYLREQDWVLRFETLYSLNKYLPNLSEPAGMDGVNKARGLLSTFSTDTSWGNQISTSTQIWHNRWFGFHGNERRPGLTSWNLKRDWGGMLFSISKPFQRFENRLKLGTTLYSYFSEGDFRIRSWFEWKASDYLKFQTFSQAFAGNSNDVVGPYEDWDTVRFQMIYDF